jgi:hypothetical protein
MSIPDDGSEESRRLHLDWGGQCRTCKYWDGDDKISERPGTTPLIQLRWFPSKCNNAKSIHHGKMVRSGESCPKWHSFDISFMNKMIVSKIMET